MNWTAHPADRAQPQQGTLFGHTLAAVPRARRTDPQTSHDAAAKVPEFGDDHRDRIVRALVEHGPGTCWDIAVRTDLDHVRVARRMKELETAKRVVRAGVAESGPERSRCTVWAVRH